MPTTVFTNGCFDLLHAGHVDFLRRCRDLGDRLIVGINVDATIRTLKGSTRPICSLEERVAVLAACRYVDEVIPFTEPTPSNLIDRLRPDIIVKGPGYSASNMPEAAVVQAYGGKIVILDGRKLSTPTLIERVRVRASPQPGES
jgi:rfaE bifunctional protein nucleotidyltransferase chain/domain